MEHILNQITVSIDYFNLISVRAMTSSMLLYLQHIVICYSALAHSQGRLFKLNPEQKTNTIDL